jgi:filamentous hemagglutinin
VTFHHGNSDRTTAVAALARIMTSDALALKGATLAADSVNITAGSLAIESLQDSKVFASKQTNVGVSVSVPGAGKGASASASFDQSKEKGSFNSVAEQSGIKAGAGGFDIQVTGNTDLKGAVIASSADAAKNRLSTGTLSASDIVNTESYKASQIGLSGGIAGIGADKNASPPQNTGNDGQPDARVGSGGNAIPGIKTGIGTISAGAPSILAASGGQSGTTNSAIAPATIIIAAGPNGAQDAASQAIANSISRDTATANDGALTQEFDAAKRADVQQGFAAAKALTQQTAVFFANRAAEEQIIANKPFNIDYVVGNSEK